MLGKGGFAKVYLIKCKKTGTIFAAKCFEKTLNKERMERNLRAIVNELTLVNSIDHPSIVKFHGTFETKDEIIIIMDYCKGQDLYKVV